MFVKTGFATLTIGLATAVLSAASPPISNAAVSQKYGEHESQVTNANSAEPDIKYLDGRDVLTTFTRLPSKTGGNNDLNVAPVSRKKYIDAGQGSLLRQIARNSRNRDSEAELVVQGSLRPCHNRQNCHEDKIPVDMELIPEPTAVPIRQPTASSINLSESSTIRSRTKAPTAATHEPLVSREVNQDEPDMNMPLLQECGGYTRANASRSCPDTYTCVPYSRGLGDSRGLCVLETQKHRYARQSPGQLCGGSREQRLRDCPLDYYCEVDSVPNAIGTCLPSPDHGCRELDPPPCNFCGTDRYKPLCPYDYKCAKVSRRSRVPKRCVPKNGCNPEVLCPAGLECKSGTCQQEKKFSRRTAANASALTGMSAR